MNFQEDYNEMDGYEVDDIPILDVKRYYAVEDFEDDMKLYDTTPDWVIISSVIYKKKSREEIEKQVKEAKSKIVRRKR